MKSGTLFIVATPIGNLGDFTMRAIEVLRSVDVIAAEDTRHSRTLLSHYDITKPLSALHKFNEAQRVSWACELLGRGESIALISDAGTPLISDPGAVFVAQIREAGFCVSPIPGACAAIAALSAAGVSTDKFIFEGFLPQKSTQRKQFLETLINETRTVVFYEAPHRIHDCFESLLEVFGNDRQIVMCKELTKTFETIRRGSAQDHLDWLARDPAHQKGEFVIIVEGAPQQIHENDDEQLLATLRVLCAEVPTTQAVKIAMKLTGASKNRLYDLALSLQST